MPKPQCPPSRQQPRLVFELSGDARASSSREAWTLYRSRRSALPTCHDVATNDRVAATVPFNRVQVGDLGTVARGENSARRVWIFESGNTRI